VSLLREHFSTPVPAITADPPPTPPNRLVYLLDHEYTPRALSWTRLKGADASRVSLLRIAAERTRMRSRARARRHQDDARRVLRAAAKLPRGQHARRRWHRRPGLPTAQHGSRPARRPQRAFRRLVDRTARRRFAGATCATPSACSWRIRTGAHSSGRSPSRAGRHVHSRIDTAELPVSHMTRRQGRPYTARPDKDRRALRPRARDAGTRTSGSGVARGRMKSRCLVSATGIADTHAVSYGYGYDAQAQ